jgi:hypothetical protein
VLIEAGKSQWLTPREGGIEAKGKGMLQTYFVNLTLAKSVAPHATSPATVSDEGSFEDNPKDGLVVTNQD